MFARDRKQLRAWRDKVLLLPALVLNPATPSGRVKQSAVLSVASYFRNEEVMKALLRRYAHQPPMGRFG